MIFVLFVLILHIIAGALYLMYALDSLLYRHDLPTSRRAAKALVASVKKYSPCAKVFYDLGCAHGDLCFRLKKDLPNVEVQGIDNSVVRIFFANFKAKILGRKVSFRRLDIFAADLSAADVIYSYLWFDLMPPLEKKLQKELKPGVVVITNTSRFPNWRPCEKIATTQGFSPQMPDHEVLFVYRL